MAENNTFHLIIVSPDRVVYEGEIKKLFVPGYYQDLTILPDHTPLYTEVKKGAAIVTQKDNKEKSFDVDNAIMRVINNQVSLVLGFDIDSNK